MQDQLSVERMILRSLWYAAAVLLLCLVSTLSYARDGEDCPFVGCFDFLDSCDEICGTYIEEQATYPAQSCCTTDPNHTGICQEGVCYKYQVGYFGCETIWCDTSTVYFCICTCCD